MEDSRRLGLRHWAISDHNHLKDNLRDHPALKLMDLIGERDAAILERNTAIAEKKAAYAERDAALLQRDVAYADRNNALIERDAAIAALDMVRAERDRRGEGGNDASLKFMQMVNMAASCPSLDTGLRPIPKGGIVFGAVLGDKQTPKQGTRAELDKPKKRDTNCAGQNAIAIKSPSKKKKQQHLFNEPHNKVEKLIRDQEIKSSTTMVFDSSTVPTPYCSCTGVSQQCYRWGNGGWQSACCTNILSTHPLPMNPKKPGSRVPGRKMSGGAFKKLLEKLLAQGISIDCPIDLKNHWAKHGTNKYVTIK